MNLASSHDLRRAKWLGQSSIIRRAQFAGRDNLLEVDAIAAKLAAGDPRVLAIAAGREVLRRTRDYLQSGDNFAIETTLSGVWAVRAMNEAARRGYFVRLIYICLDNAERCIQRVGERVAQGGHSVPEGDVRRRYARSLSNVKQVLKSVDQALLYDNSGPEPQLVLEMRAGAVLSRAGNMPGWVLNASIIR